MRGRALLAFVGYRLASLTVLVLVVSFIVFGLLYVAPGSVESVLLGDQPRTPELLATIRERHHLDEPFLTQYWLWLRGALQLDFGESIRNGVPVSESLQVRAGLTLFLAVYGFILAVGAGVPLGILAAVRSRSALDRTVVGLSVLLVSAPAFVTGVFLLYTFAIALGWFPTFGPGDGFLDRLWHLALPAVTLALGVMALIVKLTRAAMIDVLEQDYVSFARARGVPRRRVIVRHALRNALVPVVTAAGLVLTVLLVGTVLVETTFALPGLGTLFVESVEFKDMPMIQGFAMLIAALIVLVNLVVDLLYPAIDPRIGFGKASS
jgi:peptide/nickel transport system permease protein